MDEIGRMLEIHWGLNPLGRKSDRRPRYVFVPEWTEQTEWGWVFTFVASEVSFESPHAYPRSTQIIYHLESGLSEPVGTMGVDRAYRRLLQAIEGNRPERIRFSPDMIARLRMGKRIEDASE